MKDNTKNKIIVIGFISILFGFFIANIIKEDEQISYTERRKLAQFPTITLKSITDGKTSKQLEEYTVDQFVARETLKNVKFYWNTYVFRQKDNNGLFLKDGNIYKIEYPLKKENVQKNAGKIKSICEKYLKGMQLYYSIIPDKNYYLDEQYLKIDVNQMQKIMQKEFVEGLNQSEIQYIDITSSLELQDYYKTDLHWKQENLSRVVHTIQKQMNLKDTSDVFYKKEEFGDFYGTYYGQLGMNVFSNTININNNLCAVDKINILSNDTIENAVTYDYEKKQRGVIYDKEKWKQSSDKYDVYLSGAVPLITIEKNAKYVRGNERELLLFRDSFGSSIAPLLLENYKKITLIDLRYVSSKILDQYVDFDDQDVLFLYSTLVLNQNVLK